MQYATQRQVTEIVLNTFVYFESSFMKIYINLNTRHVCGSFQIGRKYLATETNISLLSHIK